MSYPYDEAVWNDVVARLYAWLPRLYHAHDAPGRGDGDLEAFLEVLAAPLAAVRQNIDELHADLFIDTCRDVWLPRLAEMVDLSLVYPDATSNRIDVRNALRWRRRKGTPQGLEEMAREILAQVAVTSEGFLRVMMTQDLRLLRLERHLPDLRTPAIAERVRGSLDDQYHAVDARPISAHSGRYHPRHITHWIHPTTLFPLSLGTPHRASNHAQRFTFHPLGASVALRVRATPEARALRSDRMLPQHLQHWTPRYMGHDNGATVFVAGVQAAMPDAHMQASAPSRRVASSALADGRWSEHPVHCSLVASSSRGFETAFAIQIVALERRSHPDGASRDLLGQLDLAPGLEPRSVPGQAATQGRDLVMVRLRPTNREHAYFAGAVLELRSESPRHAHGHRDATLRREGFLQGAMLVRVPATWVHQARWFYLAADGSLYDAQQDGAGPIGVRLEGNGARLAAESTIPQAVGPGPAWPPSEPRAASRMSTDVPCARRGVVWMHGGDVDASPNSHSALAFAVRLGGPVARYAPIARFAWKGPDPSSGHWEALDGQGATLSTDAAIDRRWHALARLRREGDAVLVARFESAAKSRVLPPCEVAWVREDGTGLLIYLPEFVSNLAHGAWPAQLRHASRGVRVAVDGSTHEETSQAVERFALGPFAPRRSPTTLRRRHIGVRDLGFWEDAPHAASAAEGCLVVDPTRGRFAFHDNDIPQQSPHVSYPLGATAHVGALPASRQVAMNVRLRTPTRRVSRGGGHADPTLDAPVPWYGSLQAAFAAIEAQPHHAGEVIQIEDSGTYRAEDPLVWPKGVESLVIQASDGERPVIVATQGWHAGGARYASCALVGLALLGDVEMPETAQASLAFCTVLDVTTSIIGDARDLQVERCVLATVRWRGRAQIEFVGSLLDGGRAGVALEAHDANVSLERATLVGQVWCLRLEASEVLFDVDASLKDSVTAHDRFRGCVRFSRLPLGARTPKRHRCVEGERLEVVSRDRHDPAYMRLSSSCSPRITRGAEDGAEIGVFHDTVLPLRLQALRTRLLEFTPAGLMTGVIRVD